MCDGPGHTEYNGSYAAAAADHDDDKMSVNGSVEMSFFLKEIAFLYGFNTYRGLC